VIKKLIVASYPDKDMKHIGEERHDFVGCTDEEFDARFEIELKRIYDEGMKIKSVNTSSHITCDDNGKPGPMVRINTIEYDETNERCK